MKKIIYTTSLLLLIPLLAFKVDEMVELQTALNARTSMDFTQGAGNVKMTLPKGTTGQIGEFKKLPSGNYGLKIKLTNGPNKDQSFWVYYNNKTPALKLLDGHDQPIAQKQQFVEQNLRQAERAVTKRDIASIRDPLEQAIHDSVTQVDKLNKGDLTRNLEASKKPCPPTLSQLSLEENYNESMNISPFRDVNESPLHSRRCQTNSLGYDVCKDPEGKVEGFALHNDGGNNIISKKEYYINRTFDFEFESRARSDMRLTVSDSPDEYTSHANYSVMMFFPRSVLPSTKKDGDTLLVTLPNKEVVKYNATTKEIIGGAMSEGPMSQDDRGRAKPAAITYTGSGVMIRADKSGDLPIGDIQKNDGTSAPSVSVATISKKGQKDCKVPARELWYTDEAKGGNVYIKKEFSSDTGLNEYIVKKCGFSLY